MTWTRHENGAGATPTFGRRRRRRRRTALIRTKKFDVDSKNHQRALDTIQISLEAEARGRLEALRQRKKLEQDVLELEAALEATVRARADVEKNYKRFQQQIRDLEMVLEEEQATTQVLCRRDYVIKLARTLSSECTGGATPKFSGGSNLRHFRHKTVSQ